MIVSYKTELIIPLMNKPIPQIIKQVFRFGIVGGLSTLLNSVIFVLLVDSMHFRPLVGNLLAFLVAFWVSYFGHFLWTFENKSHNHQKLAKFLITSFIGLAINSGFVWLLMHHWHQSAYVATIPMIFVTPLMIFFINKLWVFVD